jgi:hypothetical protein
MVQLTISSSGLSELRWKSNDQAHRRQRNCRSVQRFVCDCHFMQSTTKDIGLYGFLTLSS